MKAYTYYSDIVKKGLLKLILSNFQVWHLNLLWIWQVEMMPLIWEKYFRKHIFLDYVCEDLLYLFETWRYRKQEIGIVHLLTHSLNHHISQDQTRLKPGTRKFFSDLPSWYRGPRAWITSHCFSKHILMEPNQVEHLESRLAPICNVGPLVWLSH